MWARTTVVLVDVSRVVRYVHGLLLAIRDSIRDPPGTSYHSRELLGSSNVA